MSECLVSELTNDIEVCRAYVKTCRQVDKIVRLPWFSIYSEWEKRAIEVRSNQFDHW